MRICVYDWNHGGHHPVHVRLFVSALLPDQEIVVAASEPTLAGISDLDVETFHSASPARGISDETMWGRSGRDLANLR